MKKLGLVLFVFLVVSFFGAKTSFADIWEDDVTEFCLVDIEWNGNPIQVRGTKNTCEPRAWSTCTAQRCTALTRPVK